LYYIIDEGFGSLIIIRNKKVTKDFMLVRSCRTRRDALKHCCEYILEILEKEKNISFYSIGILDKTFKI
jgi:hypothetical protein